MASEKENKIENKNQVGNDINSSGDREGEMNEAKNQARVEQEEAEKQKIEKEKKEKKDAEPNAVNKTTSGLLKSAWENLVTSWGLTLIWIDIHVFLGMVFGNKLFCKLGMEWVPDEIKRAQFKEAEKVGKVAGTFEGTGVACMNLGCLLFIIWILMFNAMLLEVVKNPMSGLFHVIGWIWDGVSSVVSGK